MGLKKWKEELAREDGMGVVEVILIIIVLISLVIIFQDQITALVNNIFQTVTSNAAKVK
ncbi:MAG: Flp1 family type IVb pilin [Lachnospiraceae bacterium]